MAITDTAAATDTRHRIPYPNSKPRAIKVLGLGDRGRETAAAVGGAGLAHVAVVERAPPTGYATLSSEAMLQSVAEGADWLARSLEGADMIFVVAGAGDDVSFASAVGRIGKARNTLVTGVIVDADNRHSAIGDRSLDEMRRACDLLVITSDADYLTGMLAALGT